ncbi:hypothetical protein [Devosia faecipullorum]|uniref:hypothetical protein n=1 Tax=Devosia faecipullorum TaxID=2755039 RepID=UPI00187B4AB3|nr:hypothetical protein [Devosia faecipullorum]MBE7731831.1 hypothetical protein [Devosia faecipullorum]
MKNLADLLEPQTSIGHCGDTSASGGPPFPAMTQALKICAPLFSKGKRKSKLIPSTDSASGAIDV